MRILTPWSTSSKILAKSLLSISILFFVVRFRHNIFLCGQLNMRGMYSQMNVPGSESEVRSRYSRWGRNPGISPARIGGDEDKCRRSSSVTCMAGVLLEFEKHTRIRRHDIALNSFSKPSRICQSVVTNARCFKEHPDWSRSEVKLSVTR